MLHENFISSFQTVQIKTERLFLLPEKAIFWKSKGLLLIADLHLGKSTHFRKNGIAVPIETEHKNWYTLTALFEKINPKRVHFLGDLFHSTYNQEWEVFTQLMNSFPNIKFELTLGNHDILDPVLYQNSRLKVFTELIEAPFIFTHEPLETESDYYNLAGHIHPSVKLKGKGNQKHRLACFYFGKNRGLLPAFGSFTGLATIKVKKEDQVFVVVNNEVVEM